MNNSKTKSFFANFDFGWLWTIITHIISRKSWLTDENWQRRIMMTLDKCIGVHSAQFLAFTFLQWRSWKLLMDVNGTGTSSCDAESCQNSTMYIEWIVISVKLSMWVRFELNIILSWWYYCQQQRFRYKMIHNPSYSLNSAHLIRLSLFFFGV